LVEHLTPKQLEDFRRRRLGVAELLTVSDHLGGCEACRRRLEGAVNGDAAFFALRAEVFGDATGIPSPGSARAHLTPEQTALYVEGNLSGDDLQTATDHLTGCGQCVLAVDDLRAFRDQIAPSLGREYRPAAVPAPTAAWWRRAVAPLPALFRASPAPAFGAALAALLLVMFGWLVWRTPPGRELKQEVATSSVPASQPAPQPSPASQPESSPQTAPAPSQPASTPPPPPAAVVAQLNDGEGRLTLDEEGRLAGADRLPPAYRKKLKEALATRRIERPPQLRGLTRPPSALMSAGNGEKEFSVIEPAGEVLLTDRPTFRWSPSEGATAYVVEVYDDKFNLVIASPRLTDVAWAATRALPRGGVYAWQVKAFKDGREVTSPRPPAPQARFRVLDRAKANELERARRAYPSSHLTLGLLYAEAGLLKEAEQELRLLQKANPDSELARRLLRQVQALRR
jgi:hypothetical protein